MLYSMSAGEGHRGSMGEAYKRPPEDSQTHNQPDADRVRAYYAGLKEQSQLRPRARMALRLYVHGAVDNLTQAAKAVGLHPRYVHKVSRTSAGIAFMENAHTLINNTALSTNMLIEKLSRRGIEVIGTIMEDGGSEALRLKAAIDLADRGPETSKIHKHQVESFTLGSEDAKAIAESMVQAAVLRAKHSNLATENFDRVNLDAIDDAIPVVEPHPQLHLEP